MARRAKLSRVALRAQHGQQIFVSVAQPLRMVIVELVNDTQKRAQSFRVAVRQIGVAENGAEQRRHFRVFRHPRNRLGVKVQHLVPAQPGAYQPGPAVPGKLAGKETAPPAQLLAARIHIIHKLVDERNSNLLHLAFGVGNLAHQNVPRRINAPPRVNIQHSR